MSMNDNCVDRSGGIFYNQYDRTRVENTWRARLRKEAELRHRVGRTANFQMNLANQCGTSGLLRLQHSHNRIEIVTEKEIKQAPDDRRSVKGMDPTSFEVLSIKHLDKKPFQKWDLPQATSHDIGWLQSEFVRAKTIARPTMAQTASGSFFSGSVSEAGASAYAGSIASSAPTVLSKATSIVSPANDHILRRVQSAPHLDTGPKPKEVKQLNNIRWRRPQRSCDVTNYAEAYQTSLKHSPFNQAAAGR